jgi:hypothetical protein
VTTSTHRYASDARAASSELRARCTVSADKFTPSKSKALSDYSLYHHPATTPRVRFTLRADSVPVFA